MSEWKNQISATIQVSGQLSLLEFLHIKPIYNRLSKDNVSGELEAVSLNGGRSPGRLHSIVFEVQLVLQPQLIPYEEHRIFPL